MKKVTTGGGWPAVAYALRAARKAKGLHKFYQALRSRNACKTCALGMGGQRGGMVNEAGSFPEVCKKSMQAMAADMQPPIPADFFRQNGFTRLRRMTPRELEHAGRLNEPVLANANDEGYSPISWPDAIDWCADKFSHAKPDDHFFYFSGRASNEAAFLWQLFARLLGTNNVNNCSYYCHQASGVAMNSVLGSGTATVVLDDLKHCDLVFLIGGNPASNHPRLMGMLADVRQRDGRVIVINPLREQGLVNFSVPSRADSLLFGSSIASEYLQPNIGGDIALLTGLAKRILEIDALDKDFIANHTEGFDEFQARVDRTDWPEIESASGVRREHMEHVGDVYARSTATIFAWTMGITHHLHGVDNVRMIANLALMRGMVGRAHAGLLPIRGHSNVQGVGSVGVTPKLKQEIFDRLESRFGLSLPTTPGMDTLACVKAMQVGKLHHAWCLGGNLYGSNPEAAATSRAFANLHSVVYVSTTLNTGHAWGRARETLILPASARDEEAQPTTQESMFNFVRLSDGGPARCPGARSEVQIVAEIAARVLGHTGPINWSELEQHGQIRKMISQVIPGYEPMARIDETQEEFQIGGRTLHEPLFKTPTGRAKFHAVEIPKQDQCNGSFRLMTIRSEGQFNTVVYEEEDLYRGQETRNVILLNQTDMQRLGIAPGQPLRVTSEISTMTDILAQPFDIPPGNAAMYYPEANALVPRHADPESRTPAFKSVNVTVAVQDKKHPTISKQQP